MSEALASTLAGQASAALSVELSALDIANRADKLQTFGLLTVMGWAKGEHLTLPASAHVEIAGVSADISGRECFIEQQPGVWRLQINIMSHLLANGPHTLRVTVTFADGSTADFAEKRLTVDNTTPLGRTVTDDLRAFGTPAILGRIVDSQMFPYGRGKARAWFDDVEAVDVPLSLEPPASVDDAHRHLERWGFCILPEKLPADIIERFSKELYGAIESGTLQYREGSSDRIHNAHTLPAGREIWLHPPVLQFLKEHFRDTPCACQTLTYVNGSEQSAHQDTIHLTPYPAGMMSGVWIALQDVEPDSGELFVYPGSHKTPRLRASELGLEKVDQDYGTYHVFDRAIMKLVEDGGFQRVKYQPKAGQILVWHENLIHGGSPRATQDRKRFSIVSHYFAKGSVGYYDSRGEAAALEALPGLS